MRLNIARLVADLGGAASAATAAGVSRTTPYRWIERHFISSRVLERIKRSRPDLVIDDYFEVKPT